MGKLLCIRILLVEIRRRLADQAGRLRRSRFRWRKLLADLSGEVELLLDNNPSSPGRLRSFAVLSLRAACPCGPLLSGAFPAGARSFSVIFVTTIAIHKIHPFLIYKIRKLMKRHTNINIL